jgi:hypothetical protein
MFDVEGNVVMVQIRVRFKIFELSDVRIYAFEALQSTINPEMRNVHLCTISAPFVNMAEGS